VNRLLLALLVLISTSLFGVSSNGQTGVRLFLTPQVRLELERRRLGIVDPASQPESSIIETITDFVSQEPEVDVVYALGGSLIKDDGTATIWLNGVAVAEHDLPAGVEILQPVSMGKLRISGNTQEYIIKPGQVLNLTTGTVYDAYQWQQQLELQRLAASLNEATEQAGEIANPVSEQTP
jgi:hypothetical protein